MTTTMVKQEVQVLSGSTSTNKKTKGKRKIAIKKIEEANNRQVTFSKRRTGLFKKAAEICVLTGAQVAILVTSPGGRVYAFGHPNADVLVDRYLNINNNNTQINSHPPPPVPLPLKEFNRHYVQVSRELEAEMKRRVTVPVTGGGSRWYRQPVDGRLDAEELRRYRFSLAELKNKVLTRADELMMMKKSSAFFSSNSKAYGMGWIQNNFIPPAYSSTNPAFYR